ncbi:hypothetical protein [Streptomyces sp. NPDC004050]
MVVIGVLLRAGTTPVAEAAFQDRLWRPDLEPQRITDRTHHDSHRVAPR